MTGSGFARRQLLWGGLAMALSPASGHAEIAGPAPVAWGDEAAFSDGPLAHNAIGRRFVAPLHPTAWPRDTPLLGPHGAYAPASWLGKVVLVSLWADWCAPCLAEMPSFSRLNQAFGGKRFQVLPISTGSHQARTQREAQHRLGAVPGSRIETLIDGSADGAALMRRLAQIKPLIEPKPGETITATALPCILVVANGALRGRMIGGTPPGAPDLWETPAAREFVQALAMGAAG